MQHPITLSAVRGRCGVAGLAADAAGAVVPSVFSYLINRFSSAALWAGLLLTAVLCVWMNFWYLSEATAGHTRELSSLIPLMVLLFWLILPWFQLRQLSGSWNYGLCAVDRAVCQKYRAGCAGGAYRPAGDGNAVSGGLPVPDCESGISQ